MARQIQSYASSKLRAQSMRSSTVSSTRVRGGVSAGCRARCSDRDRWMTTPAIFPHRSGLLPCGTVTWMTGLGAVEQAPQFGGALVAQHGASGPARSSTRPQLGPPAGLPREGRVDPSLHHLPASRAHLVANALADMPAETAWPTVMTPSWLSSSRRHSSGSAAGMAPASRPAARPRKRHRVPVDSARSRPRRLWITSDEMSDPAGTVRPHKTGTRPKVPADSGPFAVAAP